MILSQEILFYIFYICIYMRFMHCTVVIFHIYCIAAVFYYINCYYLHVNDDVV